MHTSTEPITATVTIKVPATTVMRIDDMLKRENTGFPSDRHISRSCLLRNIVTDYLTQQDISAR